MSAISTAYDNLLAVIAAEFPNHVELINPYFPEINDDLTFDAAWGMALNEGNNTNRVIGCEMSMERSFLVTLTRKIYAGSLNRTSGTIAARRTTEKLLLEDQIALIKEFETNPQTSGGNPIIATVFESDGGLEFVRTERSDLIMLKSIFRIEYFETL
jgi:hypothetical protein